MTELQDLKLIRKDEVCEIVPVGYNTLLRMVRAGEFPKPVRISPQMVAWREKDVREWLESRPEQVYSR